MKPLAELAKIRQYSARLSKIIVLLFNKLSTKHILQLEIQCNVDSKCFANFQTNLGNLCISQDICYVRMTDNAHFLIIYGHHANLLNNNGD